MSSDFDLPVLSISKDLIERVQFSVSSRNAEAKVSECATHVFASRYVDDPHQIRWQYITSGVTCLLRNRELTKNGKKYVWSLNLCFYNATYGTLVWKGKLSSTCGYTAISDNFHVFAMSEVDGIIGLQFSERDQALDVHRTYLAWNQERVREEKAKGAGTGGTVTPPAQPRFRKEMISKPCNFQHIQGTQALDECLEIEKIKADFQAALFGLGPRIKSQTETDSGSRRGGGKKKKMVEKPGLEFGRITAPNTNSNANTAVSQSAFSPPPVDIQPGMPNQVPMAPETYYQQEPYFSAPLVQQPAFAVPPPPPLQQQPAFTVPPPPPLPAQPNPQPFTELPQDQVASPSPSTEPPYSQQTSRQGTEAPYSQPTSRQGTEPPYSQPTSRQGTEPPQGRPVSNATSDVGTSSYYSSSKGSQRSMSQSSQPESHVTSPTPMSPYSPVNGYPQPPDVNYAPPTTQDINGQPGYYSNQYAPQQQQQRYEEADLSVDAEVQQYMERNISANSLDLGPPPRLSPMTFEEDIFASTIMSSH